MAHDFEIKHIESNDSACFFGYANGILYAAFNAWGHNKGISGDGSTIIVDYRFAKTGLTYALNSDLITHYPDPSRADELREFLKLMDTHDKSSHYELFFG